VIYFRCIDRVTDEEFRALGMTEANRKNGEPVQVRAKLTGERRPPQAGEWYLSGAIHEAYRAKNDLNTAYHILKLVVVRQVNYLEEVRE